MKKKNIFDYGKYGILFTVLNSLPLLLLLWRMSFSEVMFIYWIDIGLIIILYNILMLFSQKAYDLGEKNGRMHADPLPILSRSGSIRLFKSLPPIRYRNLRLFPLNLFMGLVFWGLTSRMFLEYTNAEVSLSTRPEVRESAMVVCLAYSPIGLVMAIFLFGVHASVICRQFFGEHQYERFSAAMLAEFSGRVSWFWFVALIIGTFLTILPRANGSILVTQLIVGVIGIGGKLAADLALVRVGRGETSGWFTRWFVPYESAPSEE